MKKEHPMNWLEENCSRP